MTDVSNSNYFLYLYLAMNLPRHFGSEVLAPFLYEFLNLQSILIVRESTKCKVII